MTDGTRTGSTVHLVALRLGGVKQVARDAQRALAQRGERVAQAGTLGSQSLSSLLLCLGGN